MKDSLISTTLIFFLTISVVHAQNEVDSLKNVLSKTSDLSVKIKTLNSLHGILRYDSMKMANSYAMKALSIAQNLDESVLKARVYFNAGTVHYDEGKIDSSNFYYYKALKIYELLNDSIGAISSFKEIGLNSYSKNEYVNAQEHYMKALKMAERMRLKNEIIDLNNRMAFIFIRQEQFDKGLDYLFSSYKANKRNPDIELVKTIFNIANVYQRVEKTDQSLAYLDTMIFYADRLNFSFGKAKANGMKAYTLMDVKRFDEADAAINIALEIFKESGATADVFELSIAKARVHQEKGNYNQMLVELNEAKKYSQGIENKELLLEYYDALYICSKNLDKFGLALQYLENKTSIRDSIFKVSNAEKINELTTKYETEKKDLKIKDLSQQTQIQELQIGQRNFLLMGSMVLLLVLVVIAVLLIRQGAVKRKQEVAEIEQKLLRLQMNPHFIFNAMGAIQNFMLKNDMNQAALYLAKFSKLMRQTLEFSREEFISLEEEKELLEHYIEIHKLCSGKNFNYSIEVSEDLDKSEVRLPPMFAQPFIENAIEHGKLDQFEDGKLEIEFSKLNNQLHLTIKDNGIGIKEKEASKEHKSLATLITRERLKILEKKFGTKLDLTITDNDDMSEQKGTKVQLALPLLS